MNDSLCEQKEQYVQRLKSRVESAFEFALRIDRMRQLIEQIRRKADVLPVLSGQQKCENQKAIITFDKRMQRMVCATFDNMERYQLSRWQELFDNGGEADG